MAGNSFGLLFRISTFGESHGSGIGVLIDGCPSNVEIDYDLIATDLIRRKPGQSHITTQRKEEEKFEILSGVFEGKSTGSPIVIFIPNKDARSKDYGHIKDQFRPSHADFVYENKYGIRDYRGGGRSSARETAARVAGGAIAKMILGSYGIQVNAFVSQIGELKLAQDYILSETYQENNIVRCPDQVLADKMIDLVAKIKKDGDTIGGKIGCEVKGVPIGLGAPVFDKLQADLAKGMMSINAAKGFEVGSGFNAVTMKGSEHNDVFEKNTNGSVYTTTNHSGGVQGGISNGMDITFNVAFKPVSTIMKDQNSIDTSGNKVVLKGKGRHDPCVVPRAVPIVEAMAAITLVDHYLRAKAIK